MRTPEWLRIRDRRLCRSAGGDAVILVLLAGGAAFMSLPLVYAIGNSLKPLNELFLFPPQFFPRHPTLRNYSDMMVLMGKSWVPISRYFLNSLIIVTMGILGNVLFGSVAAYALSKHVFPGKRLLNEMIVLSLMFAGAVTSIPNYVVISKLRFMNTYWAVIVPSWASTLGLYLMKKFMDAMVPLDMLEAARIDGASEWSIYWMIAMPIVKPAWLTLTILAFQSLWSTEGGSYLYAEQLKPLPYALHQLSGGGIARAGVASAVAVVLMSVPIMVFIFNQSKMVKTMGTSGIAGE
jgi:ABC-type glycerol-3-phosphate transport system permease component